MIMYVMLKDKLLIEKRDISHMKILISFRKLFQKIKMFEEPGNQKGANSK